MMTEDQNMKTHSDLLFWRRKNDWNEICGKDSMYVIAKNEN